MPHPTTPDPQALARQRAQLIMQVRSGVLTAEAAARLGDALPNCFFAAGLVIPNDVPPEMIAIKTTEAMHYRRVALKTMQAEGMDDEAIARTSVGRGFEGAVPRDLQEERMGPGEGEDRLERAFRKRPPGFCSTA